MIKQINQQHILKEVDTQLSNLIDSAPDVLNTLNELADALNDEANYATTIQNQFATKQNNISNLPGTGEILLESDFLKRIYGVSPLNVTTYFNSNDPNDINNANIQLSIDLSSYATISTTYTQTEVDTLIANIPLSSYYTQTQLDTMFSTYYLKTDVDTLLSGKQDNLSNAPAQVGIKTYPLLLNNTIKQLKFENPLDVSEELDNRITVQLLNSHITYTSSLTFQDVNNLSLNTLQIKGGTSGIEIVDFNNNSLMDLDNTQISVNKPLVCSSTGNFTGDVTAPILYNKTDVNTLIANIPLSSYYTQTQLDTMFSTYYLKTDVDTLLSSKQDNLSNASGEAGVKSYHLLLNNTIKQLCFLNPLDVSEALDNRITVQLRNSHVTYTSSLTFEDVNNVSVNTLQIKGGTSGIKMIDFNNNSLMDLDNTQVSVNQPLVCSSSGYFTGDVTAPNLYNKTDVNTLIANISSISGYYTDTQIDTMLSSYYLKTDVDTLLSNKQDNLSNASAQVGMKTYPLLLNNTIKQLRFENPLDVSEELDNRITVQLLDSHTTYTSSLTFQDVNNLSLNTLQIKGGTSGIQIIDSNSNSLMDLDNTQVSVNQPLVCSSSGYFTGDVTAPNLYNKTDVDTLIANTGMTTELTNLLSILTVGTDTIGIKNPSPSTSIASLDIDNGLIVRSLNDNFNSEQPLIYLARGNRTGLDRHHRISGSTYHSNAILSYLKFQIHDGSDTTGNTLVDTLKLDMNGDATVNRNILLNGTVTGMTNIYTKTEVDTIIANNPGPTGPPGSPGQQGPSGAQGPAGTVDTNNFYTKTQVDSSLATKQNLLNNGSIFTINNGRGDVYFENNADDNAAGAGVTIRSSSNPNTTGSIFAVRSSGGASRLFCGQYITTPGYNDFYCGYTGSTGEENDTTKYNHKLTDNSVEFGSNLTVNGTITGMTNIFTKDEVNGQIFILMDEIATKQPISSMSSYYSKTQTDSAITTALVQMANSVASLVTAINVNSHSDGNVKLNISNNNFKVKNNLVCEGNINCLGTVFSSIKNFLIPHPTKGGNWKLKHSCLESVGVPVFYKYSHRDFVAGDNYIDLPEWYDKLVVPNTSFVMTQSHGHVGLSYGDIVDGKIRVTTNTAGVYHVILHAETDYEAGPDEFESTEF